VDMNVTVKERSTGNLMIGAGFSSSEKITLSGSVSQQNLFGSGNAMTLAVNTGKINRTVALSYTRPYFTPDGVSFGWDLYHRKVDPTSLSVAPYKTSSTGAGLRFGVPIAEDDSISFGLAADHTQIDTFTNDPDFGTSPQQYIDFCTEYGSPDSCSVASLVVTAGWARDGRDSFLFPRSGTLQRVFLEGTFPVADLRYYKASYQHQKWFPIGKDYALMLNGEVGWAQGYSGKRVPFYKNFYAGGIGSVRGFEQSSLGPKVTQADGDEDSLGGTRKLVGNAEFYFPVPGLGLDKSFRVSAFLDAGYVWGKDADGKDQKLSLSDLRYSTGLAFAWSSPMGPLKFSLGFPIKQEEGDEKENFQFQLGSSF
jgi:outer membrane protein insertion porin family